MVTIINCPKRWPLTERYIDQNLSFNDLDTLTIVVSNYHHSRVTSGEIQIPNSNLTLTNVTICEK